MAYRSKGWWKFLKDRMIRLGVPTLLYIFIIGPLTEYFISASWHQEPLDRSFIQEYTYYLIRFRFPGGTGPLWFCAALLFFCGSYVVVKKLHPATLAHRTLALNNRTIFYFTILVGVSTFFMRIYWPKGTSFYNMQLCYFPQYILFFAVGTCTWQNNWVQSIAERIGLIWGSISIIAGVVVWPILLVSGGALEGKSMLYDGGLHWQSLGLSLWEAFVGTGFSIFLIFIFRVMFNSQGRVAKFFSANAFCVYVFHPPILITLALLLSDIHLHPLVKFPLLTLVSMIACFICSEFIIRRIPILRAIV